MRHKTVPRMEEGHVKRMEPWTKGESRKGKRGWMYGGDPKHKMEWAIGKGTETGTKRLGDIHPHHCECQWGSLFLTSFPT